MLDSMFQEGTDKVLDDRVSRPLQAPTVRPSFGASVWGTMTALPKGVGAGANESAGFAADLLGAFGSVQAGYGLQADPTLLFDSVAREKRTTDGQKARAEIQTGEAFSTELGSGFRATARSFAPDPATANAAEQILFGLGKFGAKAVGYSLMAGPVPGAVLTGADEGMTEADRLKAEGVDFETRTKVGMVAGVSSAAAVALPVAGTTVKSTAALFATGGPGGFMAQQAASRAILENAGYDKIADQYDPFDPVGLAVSTLVPAAFGAYAMRGAKAGPKPVADPAAARSLADMAGNERLTLKYDDPRLDAYAVTAAQREGIPPEALLAIKNVGERSGPTAVSPKGAQGVMQFMPDTWNVYGRGNPADPVASIDAGARYMKQLISQYDGNVRAAIAHYNGGTKAGKAVAEGKAPPAKETRDYLTRTDNYLAERQGAEAGRAAAQDPEAVAAARVQLVRETVESWNLKDPADVAGAQQHLAAIVAASDQIGAGGRVDVSRAISLDNLSQARMLDDMIGRLESARADLLPEVGNIADPGAVRALRDEITQLQSSRPAATDEALRALAKEIQATEGVSYKAALSAARKDIDTRLADSDARIARIEEQIKTNRRAAEAQERLASLDRQIDQVRQDRAAVDAPTPKPVALAVKQAASGMKKETGFDPESPGKWADTRAGDTQPDLLRPTGQGKPVESSIAEPKGAATSPMAASLDAQSAEIARLSPDMLVQLEGMDTPMRLADALEAVKAEAAKEAQDAPLLQVAAECFLRST